MYHLELRHFPHMFCRFNLTEKELFESVLKQWTAGEPVEMGDRRWSPEQAKLVVVEAPEVPHERLTMGRGWRHVQRDGKDVTEQVLRSARERRGDRGGSTDPRGGGASELLISDSLGLELLGELRSDELTLSRAWQLASERFPDRSIGERLDLAERAISGLLSNGLIVLVKDPPEAAGSAASGGSPRTNEEGDGGQALALEASEAHAALKSAGNWEASDSPESIRIRRA